MSDQAINPHLCSKYLPSMEPRGLGITGGTKDNALGSYKVRE